MTYLDGLNERQKEAVLATEGPVSVLAGAGSGKTRVLTTRIYHLIRQGVPPEKILAVTFTNKAAREMRERVSARLGTELTAWKRGNLPFIATFHGLGRELLESYGRALGVPRHFDIFDRDDSIRAIKSALKSLDMDPKEYEPRALLGRISRAKGEGLDAQSFSERFRSEGFRSRVAADVWKKYEEQLREAKALDFDDLISLPVKLLAEHEDVRKLVQDRFHYIHIDEFQDTNELQGRLVDLLAGERKNVFVVGDIDQCLVAGTKVTMDDGSKKAIEKVKKGDVVRANYGSGDLRPAIVTRVSSRMHRGELVRIRTRSGKTLTSTPDHMHFAGYRLGRTPQLFFTYLMHKESMGWRLGVSQTYTNGQRASMIGFQQRCNQEHGDAVWVVGTHADSSAARVDEHQLSLAYGIPTLPFVARRGSSGGYVHDQRTLDRIFRSFDTDKAAERLLKDRGLSPAYPHHRPQATRSARRNIVVTLCGDHRGKTPMHRLSLIGSDRSGRQALSQAGLAVRPAKRGSKAWRLETATADLGTLYALVRRLVPLFPDAQMIEYARLGRPTELPRSASSLRFMPAGSVVPGMVMYDETGGYEIVEKVERLAGFRARVFDLDIGSVHNFIANGLHTHNCIYTWRGATIDNLLAFDRTYPDAKTIVLEHNYRSSRNIVDAANRVIEKNRNRKEKTSVTDNEAGDLIRVHAADTAEGEARFIAGEAKRLIKGGADPETIAVLYRTNFQSRALEEAFLAANVPYKLLGTQFFERREVKDAIAWVKLALDPSREAERIRAVQAPPRGIGKTTLGKLAAGKRDELRAGERAKVEAFEVVLAKLGQAAETDTPSEFVRRVIEESGMRAALEKGGEDDEERLENAKELATLASRHDDLPGRAGIAAFLAEAALAGDQDELDRKQEKKGVTLMTVHAAKGLEFDTVFVSGLEEGLFPHEGHDEEERDEEEERRLFYVAMTRARKRLYLTLARVRRIYGTDFLAEPSSFLADIDASVVEYANEEPERVIE